jgi:hypothetical protein
MLRTLVETEGHLFDLSELDYFQRYDRLSRMFTFNNLYELNSVINSKRKVSHDEASPAKTQCMAPSRLAQI